MNAERPSSFLEQRVPVRADRTSVEADTGALIVRCYDHDGNEFDTILDFKDEEACRDFLTTALGALVHVTQRDDRRLRAIHEAYDELVKGSAA